MKVTPRLSVSIKRADGRVVSIGCVKGGRWYEMILPRIRLWLANRDAQRKR